MTIEDMHQGLDSIRTLLDQTRGEIDLLRTERDELKTEIEELRERRDEQRSSAKRARREIAQAASSSSAAATTAAAAAALEHYRQGLTTTVLQAVSVFQNQVEQALSASDTQPRQEQGQQQQGAVVAVASLMVVDDEEDEEDDTVANGQLIQQQTTPVRRSSRNRVDDFIARDNMILQNCPDYTLPMDVIVYFDPNYADAYCHQYGAGVTSHIDLSIKSEIPTKKLKPHHIVVQVRPRGCDTYCYMKYIKGIPIDDKFQVSSGAKGHIETVFTKDGALKIEITDGERSWAMKLENLFRLKADECVLRSDLELSLYRCQLIAKVIEYYVSKQEENEEETIAATRGNSSNSISSGSSSNSSRKRKQQEQQEEQQEEEEEEEAAKKSALHAFLMKYPSYRFYPSTV